MAEQLSPARVRSVPPAADRDAPPAGTATDLVFRLVTDLAWAGIPPAAGAGISLLPLAGGGWTCAATTGLVTAADDLQYRLDQGPCLSAGRRREVVRVPDVRSDRRWPDWTAAVAALGVGAVLSVPLDECAGTPGSLNVYAGSPGAFDDRDERLLRRLAHAAGALARAPDDTGELRDRLAAALRDRDVVNTARGVLMARHGLDEETALQLLLETSRTSGTRLREVAEDVVRASAGPRR